MAWRGGQGRRWRGRRQVGALALFLPGFLLLQLALVPGSVEAASPGGRAVRHAEKVSPWHATQLPVPAGGSASGSAYAGPVACMAVGHCLVLGEYVTRSGLDEDMVATETSSGWTSARLPLPPGSIEAANLGPYELVCTPGGNCVGVSAFLSKTALADDILVRIGSAWSAVTLQLPPNAVAGRLPTVAGMACPRISACVIAGTYSAMSGDSEGFLVTEAVPTGSSRPVFSTAEVPVPGSGNDGSALAGVSCSAPGTCVAAGYYVTTTGHREPFLVNDSGGRLSAPRAPLPAGAAANPLAELEGVSCPVSSPCLALGSYAASKGGRQGFIDSGGRSWASARMPLPSGSRPLDPSPVVLAVACKPGGRCLATGQYTDAAGKPEGMALLEDAGSWTAFMMPGTAGTNVIVRAAACASARSCAAVGRYDRGGKVMGYLLTLTGTTLSGASSPAPADAAPDPGEDLGFVTCPWIATCVASGTYASGASPAATLPVAVGE